MASAATHELPQRDWILANSWAYAFLGLGLAILGWIWVLAAPATLDGVRVTLVLAGVLLAGVALLLRLTSSRSVFLHALKPDSRRVILAALTLLFGLVALATTAAVLLALPGIFGWHILSLHFGGLLYLWLAASPVSFFAAWCCREKLRTDAAVTPQEEAGTLMVLAGFTAFAACWALFDPADPLRWDTFRTFLGGLVLVALVAAPLLVVSQAVRRAVLSVLILLHFGGICSAVLAAPPSPSTVSQLWVRIYRPYLEFMYLNNAYHFYAPEPGPASYLWFRMFYEAPDGQLYGHWYKIPKIDAKGWHKHPVSLEYQRILAVTENAVSSEPTPSFYTYDERGQTVPTEWFKRRVYNSPVQQGVIVGVPQPDVKRPRIPVPFHPVIPQTAQYMAPTYFTRQVLESYARHVATLPHPDHPDWKFKSVKIYRVVHAIPLPADFVNGGDVRDPELYRPYFMGEYDGQGKLLDPEEPLLYWLLPNLRQQGDPGDPNPPIRCWACRHAGDPEWVYRYDEAAKIYRATEEEGMAAPPLNLEPLKLPAKVEP